MKDSGSVAGGRTSPPGAFKCAFHMDVRVDCARERTSGLTCASQGFLAVVIETNALVRNRQERILATLMGAPDGTFAESVGFI